MPDPTRKGLILLSLVTILAIPAFAQSFEGTTAVTLSPGLTIPVGSVSDYYGIGPEGRLAIRFPASPSMHVALEAGIAGPNPDEPSVNFMQFPIRLLLLFPLAGEAASTPYFALGPGMTINRWSIKNTNFSETKSHFAYALKAGYLFRPESMASTFFDMGVRYEQQVVSDASDWRNIDFEIGVGLAF